MKNLISLPRFHSCFIIALFAAASLSARAEPDMRCFSFGIDSPAREEIVKQSERATGCYLKLGAQQELAFVKEREGLDLLTSAVTEIKGEEIWLKHFSMTKGEILMAEQRPYRINPLPIPATSKEARQSPANQGSVQTKLTKKEQEKLESVLEVFRKSEAKVVSFKAQTSESRTRSAEIEEFYLPEEKLPTDGYWWPHIGLPLAKDRYAPLAKYDDYVESRTGTNPDTVGWEKRYHASSVVWAGHCNGWASASILYGYDDVDLNDETNNAVISSSDLQGLRSVLSYCTRNAFYGRRYYGPRSDIRDIYPHDFHRILKYYIKELQKPVVYDYRNDSPVDNHIISGYKFTFQETGEDGKWLVKADLRSHKYSYDDYVRERRTAPEYARTYWYYLWENRYGRFYRGEWLDASNHPDFVWVPLSESRCGGENPRLREYWLNHMLENLEPR